MFLRHLLVISHVCNGVQLLASTMRYLRFLFLFRDATRLDTGGWMGSSSPHTDPIQFIDEKVSVYQLLLDIIKCECVHCTHTDNNYEEWK